MDIRFIKQLLRTQSYYFNKPYTDNRQNNTSIIKTINGHKYIVHRFNHGLLHSIRQGLLAVAIVNVLLYKSQFINKNHKTFMDWLICKINNDPYFLYKVMLTSSFQRSGRQSEVASSQNKELYDKYEYMDTVNFRKEVGKFKLFKSDEEMMVYKNAILWSLVDGISEYNLDVLYLRKILHAAHILDLRRIPYFDIQRVKNNTLEILFDNDKKMMCIVDILFDVSGWFLRLTGERDMVHKKVILDDKFFILTNDLDMLAILVNNVINYVKN